MTDLQPRLRADLLTARKARDTTATAARRHLTDDDVRSIISGEQTERLSAATDLESQGAGEKAEQLRAEAELLAAYL